MNFAERINSGRQAKPMRSLFYGVEGVGKTELAAQYPKPFFLAAEDGVSHVDTESITPTDWADLMNIISWLCTDPSHGFRTLNIDSAGWAEMLAAKAVCKDNDVSSLEDIGYGRWKQLLVDKFADLIYAVEFLYGQGMHVNWIAHSTVKRWNDPSGETYDRFNVDMKIKDNADRLIRSCDNVGFMNFDTRVTEKQEGMQKKKEVRSLNQRLVHFKRSHAWDAKTRMGLPEKVNLGTTPAQGFAAIFNPYVEWCKSIDITPTLTQTNAAEAQTE